MGIQTNQSNTPATNVRYSAFLGMLYVSTQESEAAIKEAKAAVGGDDVVKKGYAGDRGDSASAKARKMLADKGIVPVTVIGALTSAKVVSRDVDGRPTPYLNVGMKDDDGRYYISVALAQQSAQMLARKLANSKPGIETSIKLFATYDKKEGADRAYAEHGASVVQNGEQVPGIDPRKNLVPAVDAALEAIKAAGVDDKETLNKRRATVELQFHERIMEDVAEMFDQYYKEADPADKDAAMAGAEGGKPPF